eukprot:NODE_2782_length_1092_cov_64.992746_g2652_i0.p1 GENE.NODE_2782_length_1092_cov_64.992746_g2652_i0~~NODE_2782_length_1092_cov_64.992746_g2652_i0.p1  ORF type:complete len:291 (+),score=38.64 NODE_2782_length_1092_cov_64.992746_g2652_i0:58-930(+)
MVVTDEGLVAKTQSLLRTKTDLQNKTLSSLNSALETHFKCDLSGRQRFIRKTLDLHLLSDQFEDVSPAEEEEVLGATIKEMALKKTPRGKALPTNTKPLKQSKSSRKDKDSTHPKRALSAYNFFFAEHRESVCAADKNLSFAEVSGKVGTMWQESSAEEKAKFAAKAQQDKRRYDDEMSVYLAKGGSAPSSKRTVTKDSSAAKRQKPAPKPTQGPKRTAAQKVHDGFVNDASSESGSSSSSDSSSSSSSDESQSTTPSPTHKAEADPNSNSNSQTLAVPRKNRVVEDEDD